MPVTITNLVLWKSSGTLLCLQHNYPVTIKSVNGNQNGVKAGLMRYTERKQISFLTSSCFWRYFLGQDVFYVLQIINQGDEI